VNIVILDACRNNPFGNRLQPSTKGLAQVDAPPGTMIAFATAPGSTAADGTGRNGLYTHHLVRQMDRPDNAPLSFGGGIHFCLGAPLARLEAQVAFPAVLGRFPRLELAGEPQRRDSLTLRGLTRLPIKTGK